MKPQPDGIKNFTGRGLPLRSTAAGRKAESDPFYSTQAATDSIDFSRSFTLARISADGVPLHQQVSNLRRVLSSSVLAWHRQEQTRRLKASGLLRADFEG